MKKVLLFSAFLCTSLISFSQGCPIDFKRNNGNGTCPGGKITMSWGTCPAVIPTIDSMFVDGVKINVTIGAGICVNNKVEYCVLDGNIPTAGVISAYFSLNGAQSSAWTCFMPEGGPLPIELNSFYAKRNNALVDLSWKTATEINAKEFILERKTTAGYVAVATIPARNLANGSSYSYTDNNGSKTVSEYRIRMVDLDGSFKYSDTRTVKGTSAVSDFSVFPNPSAGNAKVTISDIAESTDVQVVDYSGRILKNISMNNSNSVELNNLSKGMYLIRIVNKVSGESLTKKLTVIN